MLVFDKVRHDPAGTLKLMAQRSPMICPLKRSTQTDAEEIEDANPEDNASAHSPPDIAESLAHTVANPSEEKQ